MLFREKEHDILFDNTEILSTTNHYHARLQREAIEIFKHPNNFNRKEEGVKISSVWHPVLRNTKTKPYSNKIPSATPISVDAQSQASPRSDSQSEASARNHPLRYHHPRPINTADETSTTSVASKPLSGHFARDLATEDAHRSRGAKRLAVPSQLDHGPISPEDIKNIDSGRESLQCFVILLLIIPRKISINLSNEHRN